MNRHILPIILIATAFSACSHKDGKPDTRQRLQAIYAYTEATFDNQPYYTTDRLKVQEWFWDGKEVYRIDYSEDLSTYSENIFYDNHHRILRTTIPAKGLRSEFAYEGRQLASIEVYLHDVLNYTLTFTHDHGHIVSILQENASSKTRVDYNPLHLLMGDVLPSLPSAKGGTVELTLEWDDDNLVAINNGDYTMRLTYDDQRNPLLDLYTLYELQDDEPGTLSLQDGQANLAMLSANNPLTLSRPFDGNPDYTFHYQYTYEGRYPATRQLTYTYTSMNDTTFAPATIAVKEIREYQYQ